MDSSTDGGIGTVSPGVAMVERMFGGLACDYLLVIAQLVDAGADADLVGQIAQVLRQRLLLAERAQHDDQSIRMGRAQAGIGEDGRLDVVDLGANGNPTQAA